MSRILVVTSVPTLPADAGNRARIKTMLDALEQAGHTIVILHALREAGDPDAMQKRWGDNYIPVAYSAPKRPLEQRLRRLKRRLGLTSAHTWGIDDWYDPSLDEQIRSIIGERNIDVVLAQYVFFSRALLAVPEGILKVLDTHDRFGNRHQRFIDAGLEPAWFSCSPAAEQEAINRADFVLAIQDQEAEYFRSLTDNPVATVGHLVELHEPATPAYPENQTVLIVGSANSINVESTQWYMHNVWPKVVEQHPDATLRIAGGICAELNTEDPSVVLLGRIDDLAVEYQTAQVVVNPMLTGTGLKIKSIEAMGAGRAVLSTESGAEGLEEAVPHALSRADDAAQMISETIRLLGAPSQCQELGERARDFALGYNKKCLSALSQVLTPA